MYNSYIDQIYKRILDKKSDEAFVVSDFTDISDYETAKKSLLRLEQNGKLKRVLRGVYYNPKFSLLLNEYEAPSPHNVASAIARNFNWTIAPSGDTSLNQLGLSTQVTAHWSYISDGPKKEYGFNNVKLEFNHKNNKEISGMSYKTAMVVQAIKTLGKDYIYDDIVVKLRRTLSDDEKNALLEEANKTTSWIYSIIKKICEQEKIY